MTRKCYHHDIDLSSAWRYVIPVQMGTDKPPVFVRFQPETKKALEEFADKDGRSLSSFLEKLAVEWLHKNGRTDLRLHGPKKKTKG